MFAKLIAGLLQDYWISRSYIYAKFIYYSEATIGIIIGLNFYDMLHTWKFFPAYFLYTTWNILQFTEWERKKSIKENNYWFPKNSDFFYAYLYVIGLLIWGYFLFQIFLASFEISVDPTKFSSVESSMRTEIGGILCFVFSIGMFTLCFYALKKLFKGEWPSNQIL